MKINGTPSPEVLSATTKNVRETAATEAIISPKSTQPDMPAPAAKRRDSVEISDAGRALASGGMSADRVSEVRQRILSGAYNAAEVVDTVARRILQRGDI
jgi:hypothetical protein